MRLLQYLAPAILLASSIVNAVPFRQYRQYQHYNKLPPFVGPPTRLQMLRAGWIDEEAKYFHEPGHNDALGHYDARYYRRTVTYDERSDTLHHMIRAYLEFFEHHGLETWIAHGTLLGWWWNGQILPWDWDIDTQVSGDTLSHLAENFNQTRYRYSIGNTRHQREYLLDVNPMSSDRQRGDGMNIIDARWIDVRNGLFIDITGLSELDPLMRPGIVSCKNRHHYRKRDLYPMRQTTFEGVPAKIPYAYDRLLVEEYQAKALTLTEYEGHRWDKIRKLWIKRPVIAPIHSKEPGNTTGNKPNSQVQEAII